MKSSLFLASLLALGWFAQPAQAQNGVFYYFNTQFDLGPGWRTSSVGKPFDLDGDNFLGTDGYDLVNLPPAPPSYLSQMTILTSTYPGNTNYAFIDDPTNPGNLFQTGTMNPSPGGGVSADLFKFVFNAGASNKTVRLSLMVDNLDSAAFNATSLQLVRTNGTPITNTPLSTTGSSYNDRVPDWLFFDISNAYAGDTFIIRGTGGPQGTATLGGVAFDSVPPTVNNTNDSGPGSLRSAVAAARAGSTITFAPSLSGQTITLTSDLLSLTQNLTIDGSALARSITISGNDTLGVIAVSNGANVSLTGLTLVHGRVYDGGAVYGAAGTTVTLTRCTCAYNFSVEGGALLNDGSMAVTQCTLVSNFASYGGGLQCRGPITTGLTHQKFSDF